MNNVTTQQSSPLHIENSLQMMAREDLQPSQFPYTVRDMQTDSVIGGSMSFLKAVLNKPFKIAYHEESTTKEKALIDALNKSLENIKPYGQHGTLANWLSMLEYGYSLSEIVLKRDNGGLYTFQAISPIHPTTIERFVFERGELRKAVLSHPDNDGLIENVEATQTEIDGSKLLLITNERSMDHPTGKSLLHSIYGSWKIKQVIREYQTISVAKNLSGVASISLPQEILNKYYSEPTSDEARMVENLFDQAQLMHAGKNSFVAYPSDIWDGGQPMFKFDVIGSGGSGQSNSSSDVDEIISGLNDEIMLALGTLLLSLGKEGGGSYALSSSKTELLQLFVQSVHKTISSEFKKAIQLAYSANGIESENIPGLEFEPLEQIPWNEFCDGWSKLVNSTAVTADVGLESFIREKGNAPKAKYTERIGIDI